jgi:hypothetical protein
VHGRGDGLRKVFLLHLLGCLNECAIRLVEHDAPLAFLDAINPENRAVVVALLGGSGNCCARIALVERSLDGGR